MISSWIHPTTSSTSQQLQQQKTATSTTTTKSSTVLSLLAVIGHIIQTSSFVMVPTTTTTVITTTMSFSASNNDSDHNDKGDNRMMPTYENLANKLLSKLDHLDRINDASGDDHHHGKMIDVINTNENRSLKTQPHGDNNRRQYWVGIAGGPGSGKTTVSQAIADLLNRNNDDDDDLAVVIPADGWHIPQKQLKEMFNGDDVMKRRGAPWTFDAQKCYHDLQRAKHGSCGALPIYDRTISDPVDDGVILKRTNRIVIVEGLYLLMSPIIDDEEEESTGQSTKKHTSDDYYESAERRSLYWWGRHKELFDERWFIKAPSRKEQIGRLVHRCKDTWSTEKDKLWGKWPDGARRRVEANDVKQMDLIAPSEDNADEIIVTT